MSREEVIQGAVFAALGCTTIDYRSARKMDEAATQIARFVEAALQASNVLPTVTSKEG